MVVVAKLQGDKKLLLFLQGKSKWGLSNGGLRPLLSATKVHKIVCKCALLWPFGPFCKGNFRCKMMTIVGRCSRLSFPATGPPDPGTDNQIFKAPGSLTHH